MSKNTDHQFTQISHSITIKGEIFGDGDLRIAGNIVGSLSSTGNIIVEKSGLLEGEIKVNSATVAGKINGNIDCSEKLILEASSQFFGNIKTKQLVIECGALFQGKCEMSENSDMNTTSK
jgi:cytoskeletal protein CcmA (bactofilin family)